jgi:hypothetical protein
MILGDTLHSSRSALRLHLRSNVAESGVAVARFGPSPLQASQRRKIDPALRLA